MSKNLLLKPKWKPAIFQCLKLCSHLMLNWPHPTVVVPTAITATHHSQSMQRLASDSNQPVSVIWPAFSDGSAGNRSSHHEIVVLDAGGQMDG